MHKTSSDIAARLAVLVELPFWKSNRACDLQGFQFGAKHSRVDRSGQTVEVGEYALHVQCAFRIRVGGEVLVASRDRYEIVDGGDTWDRRGANLLDVRMERLIADRCPVRVVAVRGSDTGDLTVEFDTGLVLEVWIDDSGPDEHWRFFKSGDESSHVVFEEGRLQHD
jgi:hypothetical protein